MKQVVVNLNEKASDLGSSEKQDTGKGVHTQRFKKEVGVPIAKHFFINFLVNDPYARLGDLEICFKRMKEYNRVNTFPNLYSSF